MGKKKKKEQKPSKLEAKHEELCETLIKNEWGRAGHAVTQAGNPTGH